MRAKLDAIKAQHAQKVAEAEKEAKKVADGLRQEAESARKEAESARNEINANIQKKEAYTKQLNKLNEEMNRNHAEAISDIKAYAAQYGVYPKGNLPSRVIPPVGGSNSGRGF